MYFRECFSFLKKSSIITSKSSNESVVKSSLSSLSDAWCASFARQRWFFWKESTAGEGLINSPRWNLNLVIALLFNTMTEITHLSNFIQILVQNRLLLRDLKGKGSCYSQPCLVGKLCFCKNTDKFQLYNSLRGNFTIFEVRFAILSCWVRQKYHVMDENTCFGGQKSSWKTSRRLKKVKNTDVTTSGQKCWVFLFSPHYIYLFFFLKKPPEEM